MFATGKPSSAELCHRKTSQRRVRAWENLSDCFRFGGGGLGGSGLGGRGLGHPCEKPLGNLATVRVAHPGLVSGCQILVPNKGSFFRSCPRWVGHWRLGDGLGWRVDKFLQRFCMFLPRVFPCLTYNELVMRGDLGPTFSNFGPDPKIPKMFPKVPGGPQAPKNVKICLGPGPLGPIRAPGPTGAPSGVEFFFCFCKHQ